MKVAILTTGGTFDKVYFDANSEYSIGDPCITAILDEGNEKDLITELKRHLSGKSSAESENEEQN